MKAIFLEQSKLGTSFGDWQDHQVNAFSYKKKVLQDFKLYPIIRILVLRLKNIILSSGRTLPLMLNLYLVNPYTKVKKINSNNKMILIFW